MPAWGGPGPDPVMKGGNLRKRLAGVGVGTKYPRPSSDVKPQEVKLVKLRL